MTPMQFTTPTERFHISSYGNGWAYEVTCQKTGQSLFFQDHDADFAKDNTNNFENEDAIGVLFDCLID